MRLYDAGTSDVKLRKLYGLRMVSDGMLLAIRFCRQDLIELACVDQDTNINSGFFVGGSAGLDLVGARTKLSELRYCNDQSSPSAAPLKKQNCISQ